MVVRDPGPAMSGKAKGTMDEPLVLGSDLKNVNPNTNSKPIKNSMSPPAIEKEATSKPKKPNRDSPKYKNSNMIPKDIRVAFRLSIFPNFFRKSIINGIAPKISMTANRVIVIVITSFHIISVISTSILYIDNNAHVNNPMIEPLRMNINIHTSSSLFCLFKCLSIL